MDLFVSTAESLFPHEPFTLRQDESTLCTAPDDIISKALLKSPSRCLTIQTRVDVPVVKGP